MTYNSQELKEFTTILLNSKEESKYEICKKFAAICEKYQDLKEADVWRLLMKLNQPINRINELYQTLLSNSPDIQKIVSFYEWLQLIYPNTKGFKSGNSQIDELYDIIRTGNSESFYNFITTYENSEPKNKWKEFMFTGAFSANCYSQWRISATHLLETNSPDENITPLEHTALNLLSANKEACLSLSRNVFDECWTEFHCFIASALQNGHSLRSHFSITSETFLPKRQQFSPSQPFRFYKFKFNTNSNNNSNTFNNESDDNDNDNDLREFLINSIDIFNGKNPETIESFSLPFRCCVSIIFNRNNQDLLAQFAENLTEQHLIGSAIYFSSRIPNSRSIELIINILKTISTPERSILDVLSEGGNLFETIRAVSLSFAESCNTKALDWINLLPPSTEKGKLYHDVSYKLLVQYLRNNQNEDENSFENISEAHSIYLTIKDNLPKIEDESLEVFFNAEILYHQDPLSSETDDALTSILKYPSGWMKTAQDKKIGEYCIPLVFKQLYYCRMNNKNWRGVLEIADMIADSTKKLYTYFENNKLAEIIQLIAQAGVELIKE